MLGAVGGPRLVVLFRGGTTGFPATGYGLVLGLLGGFRDAAEAS